MILPLICGIILFKQDLRIRVVLIIDEFDTIPRAALKGFLHSLRRIYLADENRCPHSVSIIGVKSITQLSYDRSVSPFNIQDEFNLPNFTFEQVCELLGQYTEAVGQTFAEEVIASIHKQTAGQPVLVNHFAEILTETLDIPKTEPITMAHFLKAHAQLLEADNVNLTNKNTSGKRLEINFRITSLLRRRRSRRCRIVPSVK